MKLEINDVQRQFYNDNVYGRNSNMTAGFRRAMTWAYMPDGNVFNAQPYILPDSYLEQVHVDDPLNYHA